MNSYISFALSLFLASNLYADTKEITIPFITNGKPYVGSIKLTEDQTSTTIYINEKRPEGEDLSAYLQDISKDDHVDHIGENYKTKEKQRTTKRTRMQMSEEERTAADEWFKRLKSYVNQGLPLGFFQYDVDEE